jgi:diacylglycerol O-acyltransferase
MKQLGILDSAFINLEHPNTPQQVGGLGIYDPSTAPGDVVRFKDVLENFEQRLARMPVFRTRLVEVPGGIDRPYWVTDDEFDVEYHIRHIALPEPGDWRQLCIQVARLHSRPLDMSIPLWECYIIEGLDNIPDLPAGSFAVYTKMHHSLVDGAGGQSFMAALHDLEPDPAFDPTRSPREVEYRYPTLGSSELIGKAFINRAKNFVPNIKGLWNTAKGLGDVALKIQREDLPPPPMDAPRTRFDDPVGPHRVFEASLFSLDDFKSMKNATGTTINDVAVTIIAGAVRRYLEHHHELPEQSLPVNMPVNMRKRIGETDDNNQVGSIMGEIHTDIADPIERLYAVQNSLIGAKKYIDTPFVDPLKLPGLMLPAIAKPMSRFYVDRQLTKHLPVGGAGVITNVPGPNFDLYCAGARLVQFYCQGLLTPGGGLFHAVFSCSGTVSISILSDRDMMPDPQFYKQCLEESFAEMKAACEAFKKQMNG